ncbi:MAG: bifunctional alpha,alpha-trehalose-phosphate synthase (UDP-forming)/trehalose-phosphatase [Pseudomonadota bacterium]|nr:bifunctional alpha,alpha-trehalose-phosphate synthase (UDP-forming)/trehalose-phosphatase [Pseudomonadota bacterium]
MGLNNRVILVSNRLPVRVRASAGRVDLEQTVGGLATGLAGPHRERQGEWVGWPGDVARLDATQRLELDESLRARRLVPVQLTAAEVQRYYEGFSNGVLWPLLHSMPTRMPLECRDWDAYVGANERFADVVAERWRPGDLVWVHDYHLLLVPSLLRARLPSARIGVFLHVPFPASDVFRVLPRRAEILRGMLGADLIGFQTFSDQSNFLSAVLRALGVEADVDRLEVGGREVRVGAFPIGVDFAAFDTAGGDEAVDRDLARSAGSAEALLLGVDRLDYTKGIPRRLLAFERLLERHPRWRKRVRLLQVSVPTREGVGAYRELRRQVDELVGRINGDWSTIGWVPIQQLHRSFDNAQLRALYRRARVMVVSPLRDGMNLVAKEFVASRKDERGVLVLSEFAGAAAELSEALPVNPHDVDAMADVLDAALSMPESEQTARMRAMRERLRATDIDSWSAGFLGALAETGQRPIASPLSSAAAGFSRIVTSGPLSLLLDYDGTLVPLALSPGDAAPDPALRQLLGELAALPGVDVHIVSGRAAATLEAWLGHLPLHLHAEHAGRWRPIGAPWGDAPAGLGTWKAAVRDAMRVFAARTPGALVEEKATGLAWHYRRADVEQGAAAGRELRHHLGALLANAPVEVIAGSKVIEVRPQGVHKGLAVGRALECSAGATLLAFGDDRTDDDLFAALPEGSVAVAVGDRPSRAAWRIADPASVRRLLGSIPSLRAGMGKWGAA